MQSSGLQPLIPEVLDGINPLRIRFIPCNARLVDARKAKGWNQNVLSRLTGIQQHRISQIETLRVEPHDDEKGELADALECDCSYLFPIKLMELIRSGVIPEKRLAEFGEEKIIRLTAARVGLLQEASPDLEEVDRNVDNKLLKEQVRTILETLHPREQRVLILRYGLDDGNARTYEEVGIVLGVTRERIRQIEAKALQKLRHPSRSKQLGAWEHEEREPKKEQPQSRRKQEKRQRRSHIIHSDPDEEQHEYSPIYTSFFVNKKASMEAEEEEHRRRV